MNRKPARVSLNVLLLMITAALAGCATEGQLLSTSRELEGRTETVRSELAGKIDQLHETQRRADSQQAELKRLVEETKRELKETRQLAAELQSNLREIKEQDLSGLQGRLEQNRQSIRDMQGRLDDQSAQVSGMINTVDQKLAAKLQTQGKTLEEQGGRLGRHQEVLTTVGKKMDDQDKRAEALAGQMQRLEAETRATSARVNQFQATLSEFSKALHALKDKSAEMDRRVAESFGKSEGKIGLLTVQEGEQAAKLEKLTKQVEIEGQAVATHLNEVTRNLSALAKAMESVQAKVGNWDAAVITVNETVRALGELKRAMEEARPSQAAAPVPKPMSDSAVSPKEAYERAYQEFTLARYDSALASFRDFLIKHPDSSLIPNVHFWIAECYFKMQDYAHGNESYDQVIKHHPNSGKAATALYRKAMALLEVNNKAAAKAALRQLIADYPKSDESARARTKLTSLQ